jgi:hypothetical protein
MLLMPRVQNLAREGTALFFVALTASLAGCEGGDLINPNSRPVPGYAIQSPFAITSANE